MIQLQILWRPIPMQIEVVKVASHCGRGHIYMSKRGGRRGQIVEGHYKKVSSKSRGGFFNYLLVLEKKWEGVGPPDSAIPE